MKTHHLTRIMAKEMREVTIKTINHKEEKMMTTVMVAPIEAMDNRHLLRRTSATTSKNNNNNAGYSTKREKLAKWLTQIH